MVIWLALLAATAYGVADFVGGVVSQKASPWAVAWAAQLGGSVVVLSLVLVTDGSPDGSDLAWTLLAGLANGVGTAFLYRGLSSGRMGVVAPVSGVGAAVVPVAVGLLTGDRPALLAWLGILIALPGIWLVSRDPAAAPVPDRRRGLPAGVGDGVAAGLGFGVLFVALAQIPEEAGLLPLALNQVVAGVVIMVLATATGQAWLPRTPRAGLGAVAGLLGALATGAYMVATQDGELSVVAVIASLYPAVTVVLAATLLRERIHRGQAYGLLLCVVAIGLVAAG